MPFFLKFVCLFVPGEKVWSRGEKVKRYRTKHLFYFSENAMKRCHVKSSADIFDCEKLDHVEYLGQKKVYGEIFDMYQITYINPHYKGPDPGVVEPVFNLLDLL